MAPSDTELYQEIPPGTRVGGHYVIRELIGDGGMGSVYRATHEVIDMPVAIKVLDRELVTQPMVVVRFLQEARAASRVRHENIVEVTDFGETDEGRPYMVMEYLEGEVLSSTLRRDGPFTWDRTRPILLQVLAALQAAHEGNVIHRDIKPENVFRLRRMGSDDFVKVFDFGIAKVLMGDDGNPARPLTVEGRVLGTPAYMSPEQCLGEPLDARSDVYAAGILAFEMATGRPPFDADEPSVLLYNHVYHRMPKMSEVAPELGIPSRVDKLIQKALRKAPAERYESAHAFAEAILDEADAGSSSKWPGLRALLKRRTKK